MTQELDGNLDDAHRNVVVDLRSDSAACRHAASATHWQTCRTCSPPQIHPETNLEHRRFALHCACSATTRIAEVKYVKEESFFGGALRNLQELIMLELASCDQRVQGDLPITTLMICDIPCCVQPQGLMDVVDSHGFAGTYDFCYLPSSRKKKGTKIANLGYAFINFKGPQEAADFAHKFANFQFTGTNSTKTITLRTASLQGLAANVKRLRRRMNTGN
eukprot:CAMPEP_0170633126 /NCGR_PEP_ID=MMETSP0224-20130122/35758_1 /TAXON_ID=285029 /ORGANISM="Togula jolla, Strain CCCM 725" /LENGTH=218 /DNA_ID=CAMNT_0010962011 /DNA_START=17 /DNA_END=673 /DNA_ORIENTATION=-